MKIGFFEVQEWEKELLQKSFPDALLIADKLTPENAETYKDIEIASCFIYSNFSKEAIDKMPALKCIATRSTGFDHIDVNYSKEKHIVVSNVPEYGSNTVAEHTFALLLNLTRKVYRSIKQTKSLNFIQHDQLRGVDLFSKTFGLVGLGKIGKQAVRIAKGFGMNVIAYNRSRDEQYAKEAGFSYADLETVITQSDVISLHLPLNPETKHIINKDNILKFKKGSFLINTARGGLVDTEAILLGLSKEILAGVGLDVLEEEKELGEEAAVLVNDSKKELNLRALIIDHVLLHHPNVIITPHNAFNSQEALMRIERTTIENVNAFLNNAPLNQVS